MFTNIGKKIKALAKVICWLGIISSCVGGIILMTIDEDLILLGLLIAIAGSFLSWIGSFFTYGIGQLIDNTDILVAQNKRNSMPPYPYAPNAPVPPVYANAPVAPAYPNGPVAPVNPAYAPVEPVAPVNPAYAPVEPVAPVNPAYAPVDQNDVTTQML